MTKYLYLTNSCNSVTRPTAAYKKTNVHTCGSNRGSQAVLQIFFCRRTCVRFTFSCQYGTFTIFAVYLRFTAVVEPHGEPHLEPHKCERGIREKKTPGSGTKSAARLAKILIFYILKNILSLSSEDFFQPLVGL